MVVKPPPDQDDEPPAVTVDGLTDGLRPILRTGLRRARPPQDSDLADLVRYHARHNGYGDRPDDLADALRDLIGHALGDLGDGPAGDAARALFGHTPETRVQNLTERRRIAADALDIAPKTFRANYQTRIVTDVATSLYRAQHPPRPAPRPSTPDTSDPAPGDSDSDSDSAQTPALVLVYDGDTAPNNDGDTTAPVTRTARVLALPTAARGQLGGLVARVPRYRYDKALLVPATAAAIWARWGTPAVLRFAGVLVVAGLVVVASEVVRLRSGTASTLQVLYERVPRIIILALVGVLILNLTAAVRSDTEERASDDPCIGVNTPDECRPAAPPEPTTTSPNAVPTTYADPGPAQPAECPPDGNEERRLAHDDVPPTCINSDRAYIAHIATNFGSFDITLDTQGAPAAVNNFVYLARWNYYDGVQLSPWYFPSSPTDQEYLVTNKPVEANDVARAPGYTLVFDHTTDYPQDDRVIYVVMATSGHPDQFMLIVTPDAHNYVTDYHDQNPDEFGALPLVGQVTACRDIIAEPATPNPGYAPRVFNTALVISDITITEHDPTTITDPRPDLNDHCREEQADLPQPEDLDPSAG